MRPIVFAVISVTSLASFAGLTAAEARPAGAQRGAAAVHAGGLSARGGFGPSASRRAASFRTFGSGQGFGRRDGRGLNFAYGGFGYGAYGTSGYYGYGSVGYADTGFAGNPLVSLYGPLVTPGYGGIRDAPVAPPAIYVIDKPSSRRSSAARRSAGDIGVAVSGAPERTGSRIVQVRR